VSDFKGRHFEGEIVLWAVRWYCRYGVSYRDLEQMMGERGVSVDHSTIYRWVQKYAPEIDASWRADSGQGLQPVGSAVSADLVVCPACSIAWGWKSPIQPDGGEGLAEHKGVIARWRLKAVPSKTAT
jgi:hypothetical protein